MNALFSNSINIHSNLYYFSIHDKTIFAHSSMQTWWWPKHHLHHYHEASQTKIRAFDYSKTYQIVVGLNAKALYMLCLMQDMPTGPLVRRSISTQLTEIAGKMASEWLGWD